MVAEELRHLGRRDADEPHLDAARAHLVGPRGFVLVIDERRQDQRDVAVGDRSPRVQITSCPARARIAADVRHVHARDIVKLSASRTP